MVYNVRVDNKILRLISKSEGDTTVGGNKGDIVNFEFDADWDVAAQSGKPIKAIFRYGGTCVARDVVDNQCEVPPIYRSSKFRFGVIVGETEEETPFLASTTIEVPSVLSARDYVPHGDMSDEQFYIGAFKILKEAQELNARTEVAVERAETASERAAQAVKERLESDIGLTFADDGGGNAEISSTLGVKFLDDGNGNINIMLGGIAK